jgi:hypothetical protein
MPLKYREGNTLHEEKNIVRTVNFHKKKDKCYLRAEYWWPFLEFNSVVHQVPGSENKNQKYHNSKIQKKIVERDNPWHTFTWLPTFLA